jgi:hypothetical protein
MKLRKSDYTEMSSPVQCLASEIVGLLQDHQACLKTPKASQLTLESYSRILPQHISAALQQCEMVSKERMASALDFDPGNSSYWSARHRDIVFGANYNAFASKFTGFSICHPVYDDTKMLKCVQHSLSLRCVASYQPPPSYSSQLGKQEHQCL